MKISEGKFFYGKLNSKNKEIYIIEDGYHELYKDTCKQDFFNKVYQWINKNKNSGKTDKRK